MRLVMQAVEVHLTPGGLLRAVRWNERTYPVTEVLDAWHAWDDWWLGHPPRDVWLLRLGNQLVAELFHEDRSMAPVTAFVPQEGSGWVLARVAD